MLQHKTCQELVGLTMLVYDYIKKFQLNQSESIETFLSTQSEEDLDKYTDARKEVLQNMKSYAPHGTVEYFIDDKKTDLQVGITKSGTNKRICVVFRGSESRSDWYYDLMITKHRLSRNIYVHSGFHSQLHINKNFEKISECVKQLLADHPDYTLYVTGHSLGAALATLYGYQLSKIINHNVVIVSFASPRVGNYDFKDDFNKQKNLTHYRVTNNRDIITATPMVNYHHVGINICLYNNSYEMFDNYEYRWWKYSLFNCWSVKDHNIDLYYERLKKHVW